MIMELFIVIFLAAVVFWCGYIVGRTDAECAIETVSEDCERPLPPTPKRPRDYNKR